MGPGLLIKALLQGSFSLMVFGWTQIVMDLQPLIAILTRQGKLHGFTHTYLGASLIAIFAAVTGRMLATWVLTRLQTAVNVGKDVRWWVALVSAFIGSFTHVILDSVMHRDMQPFFPLSPANDLLGIVSIETLHRFCLLSGVIGAVLFFAVDALLTRYRSASDEDSDS